MKNPIRIFCFMLVLWVTLQASMCSKEEGHRYIKINNADKAFI